MSWRPIPDTVVDCQAELQRYKKALSQTVDNKIDFAGTLMTQQRKIDTQKETIKSLILQKQVLEDQVRTQRLSAEYRRHQVEDLSILSGRLAHQT